MVRIRVQPEGHPTRTAHHQLLVGQTSRGGGDQWWRRGWDVLPRGALMADGQLSAEDRWERGEAGGCAPEGGVREREGVGERGGEGTLGQEVLWVIR